MTIWERTETTPKGRVSPLNLVDWRQRNQSFDAIGGVVPRTGSMVMSGANGAEKVPRQWATAGIFEALGVRPIVGRTFLAADDPERANIVVLSEAFWRTRFASDPGVVGQSIRFDGDPFTVVGVVPNQAELLAPVSIWALVGIQGVERRARQLWLQTVARLKPGVSLEAAREDLSRIAADLAPRIPTTNEGRSVTLEPLRDVVLGAELKRTSMLFLGVVGFVLLICFANIANLLLTRNAARDNELAIRSVLGADRRRLMRQFATENLLLAAVGGLAGLVARRRAVAYRARSAPARHDAGRLRARLRLARRHLLRRRNGARRTVVHVCFGGAKSRSPACAKASRAATRVTDRSSRTREVLVVGQIATAVVLLYGAGLLARTLIEVDTC